MQAARRPLKRDDVDAATETEQAIGPREGRPMKLSRPSSWISPRRELDDLLNEIEALKSAARFLRAATAATTFQSRSVTARPDRESRVTRIASVTDIKEIRHRRSPISPENPTARD
jgi:hypothetical protein